MGPASCSRRSRSNWHDIVTPSRSPIADRLSPTCDTISSPRPVRSNDEGRRICGRVSAPMEMTRTTKPFRDPSSSIVNDSPQPCTIAFVASSLVASSMSDNRGPENGQCNANNRTKLRAKAMEVRRAAKVRSDRTTLNVVPSSSAMMRRPVDVNSGSRTEKRSLIDIGARLSHGFEVPVVSMVKHF